MRSRRSEIAKHTHTHIRTQTHNSALGSQVEVEATISSLGDSKKGEGKESRLFGGHLLAMVVIKRATV